MTHGSADDVDGNVAGLGDACPTVAGDIEGEGRCELEMGGEFLQVAVDGLTAVAVLCLFGAVFTLDKGKKVLGVGIGVFVEDALYVGHDAHLHLLSGLAAGIEEGALADVGLAKMGKVDGGYAAKIEGEHEHVAGEVEYGTMAEGGFFDTGDVGLGEGSLGRLVDAGIDMQEGVAVGGESCCHCLVVDGAQVAQIERRGVAAQVLAAQPGLVGEGEHGGDGFEGQVLVAAEAHEAAECLGIVVCRTASPCITEQSDLLTYEVEHGDLEIHAVLFIL